MTTTDSNQLVFPPDFLWGAATAAYQVEGGARAEGRTPSIWDTFCRVPGAVLKGDTGDVACDHHARYREDVGLMAELNLGAYRFSTAWPRVRPDGGAVNPAGVDFYARLVDTLLEREILPWVTLYHWDLPQTLEDHGGWLNRDTAYRFAEYALTLYDALGDRVDHWTTMNEPWCAAFLGYTGGQHAPGRQEGEAGVVAAHHLMLAHGLVVDELRRRGAGYGRDQQLGITLNLTVPTPFDPKEQADRAAANHVDHLWNRVFLDPLLRGRYASELFDLVPGWDERGGAPVIREGDLELISAPLDVLGVNYYHGDAASGRPEAHDDLLGTRALTAERPTRSPYPNGEHIVFPRRGLPTTAMDWEIEPEALTTLLVRLRDEYAAPPIYITENGAAFDDVVSPDGQVDDPDRVAFIDAHLRAVRAALDQGVDVRGYFVWSLLDNFEWAYGYDQRFGVVHVDYATQKRTHKTSALWFAGIAAEGIVPPRGR